MGVVEELRTWCRHGELVYSENTMVSSQVLDDQ